MNRSYRGLRERILLECEAQRPLFGVVEVDESFFGARQVKGRRGRGAYGKTVINSDPKNPSLDEFTKGTAHINGIEGFWGLAKVRLAKFKGLPRHTFHLHLKEYDTKVGLFGSAKTRSARQDPK